MMDMMSYLGGIIDGEGCLTIGYREGQKEGHSPSYPPIIQVEMRHEATIRLLQETFGGRVGCRREGMWRWAVGDLSARVVAEKLIPYLRIKREQAEIVASLPAGTRGTGEVLPVTLALREAARERIMSLNHRQEEPSNDSDNGDR